MVMVLRPPMLVLAIAACGYTSPAGPGLDAATPGPDAMIDPGADGSVDGEVIGAWLAGYTYRRRVVVTRGGNETLANFPLAIVLASDAAISQHARSDGADLVVTTDDAVTRLDSELASYTAGAVELWTRIPSLPPGTTTLYLYYGGPATQTNPTAVWSSLFKGVWHLSDGVGSAVAIDSTVGAHHVSTQVPGTVPQHAQGVAGLARVHDGVDDRLEVLDPVDGRLDVGASSFSFSIWIHATGNRSDFDQPMFKGGTSSGNRGYSFLLGNGSWIAKIHDGTDFDEAILANAPRLNETLHIAGVVDRGAGTFAGYVNGVRTDLQQTNLGNLDTTVDFRIGRGSGGAQFQGLTDEARIYSAALSTEWLATEHANLATPGFVSVDATEDQEP